MGISQSMVISEIEVRRKYKQEKDIQSNERK
jgi:hypothetical protein